MKKGFRIVLLIVCICVFIYAAYNLATYYIDAHKNKQEIENLTPTPERQDSYKDLKQQNDDLIGWIEIEDTRLSYPLMYTPDDSEHYLRRNFEGDYAVCGLPFIDGRCDIEEPVKNFIIYGHNMKDGSMFATILKYKDNDFLKEHPYIIIEWIDEDGEYTKKKYKVLVAFYAEILPENSNQFKYYNAYNITDKEGYDSYISNVKTMSEYNTEVSAEYPAQLITLSTCTNSVGTDTGRFAVVAVEEKEEK